MSTRDRLLAVLVAVVWGVNFLVLHVALEHFPPIFLAGARMLVIAVPVLLFVPRPRVPARWLVGYGLGFGTAQFLFLFLGMAAGMPAGLASLVLQASGPFTVLLGAVLIGERIGVRQVIGIVAAVAGLGVIAADQMRSAPVAPFLLTVLGALGWAFGNLASRMAMREAGTGAATPPNPLHLTLWMTTIPPVPLLGASMLVEGPATGWRALGAAFTPQGLPGLAALGYVSVVATVLAASIWTGLMRRNPAGRVAPHSLRSRWWGWDWPRCCWGSGRDRCSWWPGR